MPENIDGFSNLYNVLKETLPKCWSSISNQKNDVLATFIMKLADPMKIINQHLLDQKQHQSVANNTYQSQALITEQIISRFINLVSRIDKHCHDKITVSAKDPLLRGHSLTTKPKARKYQDERKPEDPSFRICIFATAKASIVQLIRKQCKRKSQGSQSSLTNFWDLEPLPFYDGWSQEQ